MDINSLTTMNILEGKRKGIDTAILCLAFFSFVLWSEVLYGMQIRIVNNESRFNIQTNKTSLHGLGIITMLYCDYVVELRKLAEQDTLGAPLLEGEGGEIFSALHVSARHY